MRGMLLSAVVFVPALGGLLIALPVIMWQIWKFVVPALKANEKRYAIPFIVSAPPGLQNVVTLPLFGLQPLA